MAPTLLAPHTPKHSCIAWPSHGHTQLQHTTLTCPHTAAAHAPPPRPNTAASHGPHTHTHSCITWPPPAPTRPHTAASHGPHIHTQLHHMAPTRSHTAASHGPHLSPHSCSTRPLHPHTAAAAHAPPTRPNTAAAHDPTCWGHMLQLWGGAGVGVPSKEGSTSTPAATPNSAKQSECSIYSLKINTPTDGQLLRPTQQQGHKWSACLSSPGPPPPTLCSGSVGTLTSAELQRHDMMSL